MRLISQISPFTCGLACLESFLFDIGQRITQEEMIRLHPDLCIDSQNPHEIGALQIPKFIQLCSRLRITAAPYKDHDQTALEPQFTTLPFGSTVILLAHWQKLTHHIVRFKEVAQPGKWTVMNPQFLQPQFEPVTFSDLVAWDFRFCILARN